MHLIIDNYDSFTYNLFQYLLQLGLSDIKVIRNDKTTISEIEQMAPEGIIISPGPGRPENAGISVEVVRQFAGKIPILGVCLGHQSIGYAFGARIVGANEIVHGKTDEIDHDGKGLFRNIPPSSLFTRYHSLVLSKESIPDELEITATSRDGEIMGVRHKQFAVEGVQFHPESIASEYGKKLLKNFIHYKREPLSIPQFLGKVLEGRDLLEDEASYFMEEMTNGELSDAQLASCLAALNSKKIKAHEIAGFASVLQKLKKSISFSKPLLDTCGTGGDGTHSFNISSMAALVASACGAYVAKHGNRSVSSKSGSADFYSELGIPIDIPPEKAAAFLEKTGFVFLFAPQYHGSMKHASRVRREMGIKTVMNLMGPLLNPADAEYQLIGVFSEELCATMAEAAKLLGKKRVMVVHSLDGFDEISVSAPTRVVELDENGDLNDYILDPAKLDIKTSPLIDPGIKDSTNHGSGDQDPGHQDSKSHQDPGHQGLTGGTPKENALVARNLIKPGGNPVIKEAVLLNAGAALRVYGIAKDIKDGYMLAREALESGKVKQKLDQIVEEGQKLNALRAGSSIK